MKLKSYRNPQDGSKAEEVLVLSCSQDELHIGGARASKSRPRKAALRKLSKNAHIGKIPARAAHAFTAAFAALRQAARRSAEYVVETR